MMSFRDELDKTDLRPFLQKSDLQGLWMVLFNYGLIAAAMALVVWWPNWLTVLVAVIVLGNRQLGLGILMHDSAHYALFKTKWLNRFVGEWLSAAPILAQFEGYRRYHLKHHVEAGTDRDPDYPNYKGYPVPKGSLIRKIIRDITGITGLKTLAVILMMHAELIEYDMSYQQSMPQRRLPVGTMLVNLALNLTPSIVTHGLFILLLTWLDLPYLYGLWWLAFLTTFMLFSRIRNAAEHASVPNLLAADPRLHARTTMASPWERLTVAPNHVNYHLEHHWVASIPPYRLPAFHKYLKSRGLLEGAEVVPGYWAVLKKMVA